MAYPVRKAHKDNVSTPEEHDAPHIPAAGNRTLVRAIYSNARTELRKLAKQHDQHCENQELHRTQQLKFALQAVGRAAHNVVSQRCFVETLSPSETPPAVVERVSQDFDNFLHELGVLGDDDDHASETQDLHDMENSLRVAADSTTSVLARLSVCQGIHGINDDVRAGSPQVYHAKSRVSSRPSAFKRSSHLTVPKLSVIDTKRGSIIESLRAIEEDLESEHVLDESDHLCVEQGIHKIESLKECFWSSFKHVAGDAANEEFAHVLSDLMAEVALDVVMHADEAEDSDEEADEPELSEFSVAQQVAEQLKRDAQARPEVERVATTEPQAKAPAQADEWRSRVIKSGEAELQRKKPACAENARIAASEAGDSGLQREDAEEVRVATVQSGESIEVCVTAKTEDSGNALRTDVEVKGCEKTETVEMSAVEGGETEVDAVGSGFVQRVESEVLAHVESLDEREATITIQCVDSDPSENRSGHQDRLHGTESLIARFSASRVANTKTTQLTTSGLDARPANSVVSDIVVSDVAAPPSIYSHAASAKMSQLSSTETLCAKADASELNGSSQSTTSNTDMHRDDGMNLGDRLQANQIRVEATPPILTEVKGGSQPPTSNAAMHRDDGMNSGDRLQANQIRVETTPPILTGPNGSSQHTTSITAMCRDDGMKSGDDLQANQIRVEAMPSTSTWANGPSQPPTSNAATRGDDGTKSGDLLQANQIRVRPHCLDVRHVMKGHEQLSQALSALPEQLHQDNVQTTKAEAVGILPDDSVQWMWGDANVLGPLFLAKGHAPAQEKHLRWSQWKQLGATILDLAKLKDEKKPVEIRTRRTMAILPFDTVDKALLALRAQASLPPDPKHALTNLLQSFVLTRHNLFPERREPCEEDQVAADDPGTLDDALADRDAQQHVWATALEMQTPSGAFQEDVGGVSNLASASRLLSVPTTALDCRPIPPFQPFGRTGTAGRLNPRLELRPPSQPQRPLGLPPLQTPRRRNADLKGVAAHQRSEREVTWRLKMVTVPEDPPLIRRNWRRKGALRHVHLDPMAIGD